MQRCSLSKNTGNFKNKIKELVVFFHLKRRYFNYYLIQLKYMNIFSVSHFKKHKVVFRKTFNHHSEICYNIYDYLRNNIQETIFKCDLS